MSVQSVTRRFSGGQFGGSTRNNINFQTQAQIVFDVIVNDPASDDEATAKLSPLLPVEGFSTHPSMQWLRCVSVVANRMSPIHFEVTASYDSPVIPGGSNNNPLSQPPEIEWGTAPSDEEIDEDIKGKPICTVVGEPFDPPLRLTRKDLVLRITSNMASFDPSVIVPYTDNGGAVNSDSPLGQPPGTARVNDIRAVSISDPDITYFKVFREIQFRRGNPDKGITDAKAWWRRVRAQGLYANYDLSALGLPDKVILRVARKNQPVTSPVLHDKTTGQVLAFDPTAGQWPTAQWYEFEVHPSKPFSVLGF